MARTTGVTGGRSPGDSSSDTLGRDTHHSYNLFQSRNAPTFSAAAGWTRTTPSAAATMMVRIYSPLMKLQSRQ
jgi:hypothetical protein